MQIHLCEISCVILGKSVFNLLTQETPLLPFQHPVLLDSALQHVH